METYLAFWAIVFSTVVLMAWLRDFVRFIIREYFEAKREYLRRLATLRDEKENGDEK